MRNAHPKYQCYPSVVPVGEETTVTIFPRDISRRFKNDQVYQVAVLGLQDAEPEYYSTPEYDVPCFVKDGCLIFTYRFVKEQEHIVHFRAEGESSTKISLYAVEQDLYQLRPLKGDLHSHSYYSDGLDGVAMVPANYREEGFDFFALTDHNRMFTSRCAMDLYKDIPLGIHMIAGEEVHTPNSTLHIVHIGGKHSVCEQYIHHRDTYEAQVDKIAESLEDVPEENRRKLAMAKWASQKIREAGGLSILAHPFWQPRRFNVSSEFRKLIFDEKLFDAIELMGGIPTKHNNLQVALWHEECLKGNGLSVVGSSDSHNHDFENTPFARRFTVVFAKSNTTADIIEAIRNGYSVAAELPPNNSEDVRFYGSLRLVLFTHFLFENYFNETWRLCVGEGILMRRYAEGEDVGQALSAMADTVENFYKKFYGITPAPRLSPERMAFLDECLAQQRSLGPITKGAALYIYSNNGRRE